MNKAKELFEKILVDGQEIDLQELDTNNGIYSAGSQKTLKVDFVLKKKNEIPAKIFTGLKSLKSVKVPETVKTIGNEAFANTSLSYINLPKDIEIGKDVFKNVESLPEEVIENITYNNPYALYDSIADINDLNLENSISKNILIESSEVANVYGTNKPYFKNVVIKDAEVNSTISVKALENITFDGITGSGDKGATNGKITFTSYSLNIKNVTVGEETTIYNLFEGSQVLNDSNYHGISNVNVENVNIDCPALTHNIINVYTPANDANIVIKDSTFNLNVNNSNVLRMANYINSENVTITFDNVEWNYEDAAKVNENSDWKWAGLMIFQPASQDVSLTGDYSKLATWTINFNNCKYNGQAITGMNAGEHNQLLYFYNLNGDKKCVNPLQVIEGITINVNEEKLQPETQEQQEETQGEQESQEQESHENQTVNTEYTVENGGDTQIYNG